MWDWTDPQFLGVFIAFLTILGGAIQYIWNKSIELHQLKFEQYHRLVKELVQREDKETPKMLDRQIAVVFELRHFKKYHPVTKRILEGLRDHWDGSYGPPDKNDRLIEEINITIEQIESCKRCNQEFFFWLTIIGIFVTIAFLVHDKI